jgi:4-hydroxy-tetrahydrodipicolinate synthase
MATMSKPWESWEDVRTTRAAYSEMLPIMEACYSATNPVAVKTFVRLLGFPVGYCRKPLPESGPKVQEGMKALIQSYGLKKLYGLK